MNEILAEEDVLAPEIDIVDAHHHLWFQNLPGNSDEENFQGNELEVLTTIFKKNPRYLFDEFLADTHAGHRVCASVFIEVHAMYRASGPAAFRSVGEVEFANGMAAMAASHTFGQAQLCAGIVGSVDLRQGDQARAVLEAHVAAAPDRYRGIRAPGIAFDAKLPNLSAAIGGTPNTVGDRKFRDGFRHLEDLGLSCDVFMFEPQLEQLADLADAFPNTRIIVNHTGMPLGLGVYKDSHHERFKVWRESIRLLSQCPNAFLKLGGLGNPICGFEQSRTRQAASSEQLAITWAPYIETGIELFGVDRCMFESNFPVDNVTTTYVKLWNTFKRIVSAASKSEKTALFSATAASVYKIDIGKTNDDE